MSTSKCSFDWSTRFKGSDLAFCDFPNPLFISNSIEKPTQPPPTTVYSSYFTYPEQRKTLFRTSTFTATIHTRNMSNIQRTCANCACTETPLWRRSPLGPKTLCNACGVRMKKGRLVFVPTTSSFITVESPSAAAKRQRKEQRERAQQTLQGVNKSRWKNVSKGMGKAAGLYYLLAAIEFIETS